MRREGIGDMAAAGRDVERAPVFLRRGQRDQALQALAERVRLAGEIAGGGLAELLLDEGLAHDGVPNRGRRSALIAPRVGRDTGSAARTAFRKRHKSAAACRRRRPNRRSRDGAE